MYYQSTKIWALKLAKESLANQGPSHVVQTIQRPFVLSRVQLWVFPHSGYLAGCFLCCGDETGNADRRRTDLP